MRKPISITSIVVGSVVGPFATWRLSAPITTLLSQTFEVIEIIKELVLLPCLVFGLFLGGVGELGVDGEIVQGNCHGDHLGNIRRDSLRNLRFTAITFLQGSTRIIF